MQSMHYKMQAVPNKESTFPWNPSKTFANRIWQTWPPPPPSPKSEPEPLHRRIIPLVARTVDVPTFVVSRKGGREEVSFKKFCRLQPLRAISAAKHWKRLPSGGRVCPLGPTLDDRGSCYSKLLLTWKYLRISLLRSFLIGESEGKEEGGSCWRKCWRNVTEEGIKKLCKSLFAYSKWVQ